MGRKIFSLCDGTRPGSRAKKARETARVAAYRATKAAAATHEYGQQFEHIATLGSTLRLKRVKPSPVQSFNAPQSVPQIPLPPQVPAPPPQPQKWRLSQGDRHAKVPPPGVPRAGVCAAVGAMGNSSRSSVGVCHRAWSRLHWQLLPRP